MNILMIWSIIFDLEKACILVIYILSFRHTNHIVMEVGGATSSMVKMRGATKTNLSNYIK